MNKSLALAGLLLLAPNISPAQTFSFESIKYNQKTSQIKIVSDFEGSLEKSLKENKLTLKEINEGEEKMGEIDIYKAETRDSKSIRDERVGRVYLNAVGDAIKKTPFGIRLNSTFRKVSSWFRIKYKKIQGEEPSFVLPGEVDRESPGSNSIFEFSLNTSVYEGNSFGKDFSLGFKGNYKNIESRLLFSPLNGETKMNFSYNNFSLWLEKGDSIKGGFLYNVEF